MRQKLLQVRKIVDKELGFTSSSTEDNKIAFVHVMKKRIVGMVTAETIKQAYVLENNWERSRSAESALIGIHQLWTHANYRQQGIASRLVDAARERMVFGQVVSPELVALSSPTEAGVKFGRHYLESHGYSSERLLVYDCV